ncbi:MAG: NADP-dependent oxidoreductase [Hyphomicrobiales bacterium]
MSIPRQKTARVVRLVRRPHGEVQARDFSIADEPVPEVGDGQIQVKVDYVSLDPAMRGWMNEGKSYVPPVGLGEVMRAIAVGHVEASRNPKFKEGDAVVGRFGVQTHAVSGDADIYKVDESAAPLYRYVGGLGMPGLTAYFGLKYVAQAKAGDTVVVSAASGAVGQVVGQIAKLEGCRAVGIAGGPEKCKLVTDAFGFDAAVDHKRPDLEGQLKAACPKGIDVDFENVGGEIFDTVLGQMNRFGRVALCGLISMYNATELPPGPKNIRSVLTMRLKVQGFIVFDFLDRYPEALAQLAQWAKEGKLKFREDVREGGVDAFPESLKQLYTGGNTGKLVLKL